MTYDTPVEELPGILGYDWDDMGFYSLSEATKSITDELVSEYDSLQFEFPENAEINLPIDGELVTIKAKGFFLPVLGNLPAVDVVLDRPEIGGPGEGAGYLVFLADGFTIDEAKAQIDLFVRAAEALVGPLREAQ